MAAKAAPLRHGEQGKGFPYSITRSGEEMWPLKRPRSGTASRGKGLPYSIDYTERRGNVAAKAVPPRHGEQGGRKEWRRLWNSPLSRSAIWEKSFRQQKELSGP